MIRRLRHLAAVTAQDVPDEPVEVRRELRVRPVPVRDEADAEIRRRRRPPGSRTR